MKLNLSAFSKLKLSHYVPLANLDTVSSFEYYDQYWQGEVLGFTSILQPQDPLNTKCIALQLQDAEYLTVYEQILKDIGIPLYYGATLSDTINLLHASPMRNTISAEDRIEYEFLLDNCYLSCTFQDQTGLIFVVISTDKKAIK